MKCENTHLKTRTYKYFKLKVVHTANRYEFAEMDDLCRYTEMYNLKEMYLLLNAVNDTEHFAIMHNNSLMQFATNGFKTVEDYTASKTNAFPDAGSYYDALVQGYTNWHEYTMVKETGIQDKAVFNKVKQNGFIDGLGDYQSLKTTIADDGVLQEAANPYQLYQLAAQCGFDNYTSFKTAITNGFTNKDTYDIARHYGFTTNADYEDAKKRGFKTFDELEEARSLKVRDYNDMQRMNDLTCVNCTNCAIDQRLLIVLLSKLEQGKKVSINKLTDLFNKSLEEYRYTDTQQMPEWFTLSFAGTSAIIDFLIHNEEVKNYGTYDRDGEFFEIKQMQNRKVVLDGSNVAHNSIVNGKDKPSLQNIITLALHLKSKGFTDISVISDASLRHKVSDLNLLPKLKEIAEYQESPKETPADIFILEHVKNTRCLLVSNDTFREWKRRDPWVFDNVDFYRLSFMIKDHEVLMPDVK